MSTVKFRVALAALTSTSDIDECLSKVSEAVATAASQGASIICFPETYFPGLRTEGLEVPPVDQRLQAAVLSETQALAAHWKIAAIMGIEWVEGNVLTNRAFVIDRDGLVLGHQAKSHIPPGNGRRILEGQEAFSEDAWYQPVFERSVFRIDGILVGIVICHEAWRYPETVRWAASRGAQVIFHPQWTGSPNKPVFQPQVTHNPAAIMPSRRWGDSFYERAMICRAQENTVFFASVNPAMRYQSCQTSIVGPSGDCLGFVPYGEEQILVKDLDLSDATGFYAKRAAASPDFIDVTNR